MARNGQPREYFGERLAAMLKERGLTHRAFAAKMGVHETGVSRWATMKNAPKLPTLWKMADIFEVTLDEMVGRKWSAATSQDEAEGPAPERLDAHLLEPRRSPARRRRSSGGRG